MKWDLPARLHATPLGLDEIDEIAARWSEVLRDGGNEAPTTRAAFEAWRGRALAHAVAFRRVESARTLVDSLADAPGLRALRDDTRARARRRWMRAGFAVAASLCIVALGALALRPQLSDAAYQQIRDAITGNVHRTDVGQRSVVTLEDGSVITLNTDSRVWVDYSDAIRAVTLERGQALFKVAENPARPFVVHAGARQVTALGTEFEVRMADRRFEVTLLEGRVAVTHGRQRGALGGVREAELAPGQQFIAVATAPPRVRVADVQRQVSWRHGQVVFQNERLDDAVAEMNRYSRHRVVLDDAALGAVKISGAFNTGDTAIFVEALTTYFPIDHTSGDGDVIVLKSRGPGHG
ncbi:MAG: FecR family protein [Luteimonas sp.]